MLRPKTWILLFVTSPRRWFVVAALLLAVLYFTKAGLVYSTFPPPLLQAIGVLLAALVFANEFLRSHLDRLTRRLAQSFGEQQQRIIDAHQNRKLDPVALMDTAHSWYVHVNQHLRDVHAESLHKHIRRLHLHDNLEEASTLDDRRVAFEALIQFEKNNKELHESKTSRDNLRSLRDVLAMIAWGRYGVFAAGAAILVLAIVGAIYANWRLAWPPSPAWWAVAAFLLATALYCKMSHAAARMSLKLLVEDVDNLPLFRLVRAENAVPAYFPSLKEENATNEIIKKMTELPPDHPISREVDVDFSGWRLALPEIRTLELLLPHVAWVHSLRGRYFLWRVLERLHVERSMWQGELEAARYHLSCAAKEGEVMASVGLVHLAEIDTDLKPIAARELIRLKKRLPVVAQEHYYREFPGHYVREQIDRQSAWLLPLASDTASEVLALVSPACAISRRHSIELDESDSAAVKIRAQHYRHLQRRARARNIVDSNGEEFSTLQEARDKHHQEPHLRFSDRDRPSKDISSELEW